jgi:hypothetical protein
LDSFGFFWIALRLCKHKKANPNWRVASHLPNPGVRQAVGGQWGGARSKIGATTNKGSEIRGGMEVGHLGPATQGWDAQPAKDTSTHQCVGHNQTVHWVIRKSPKRKGACNGGAAGSHGAGAEKCPVAGKNTARTRPASTSVSAGVWRRNTLRAGIGHIEGQVRETACRHGDQEAEGVGAHQAQWGPQAVVAAVRSRVAGLESLRANC